MTVHVKKLGTIKVFFLKRMVQYGLHTMIFMIIHVKKLGLSI